MRYERDLVEEDCEEYPSHIQLTERDDGATLWLGNENAGEECDVSLTPEDIEWMIETLQKILPKA